MNPETLTLSQERGVAPDIQEPTIADKIAHPILPEGSSRQLVRQTLFKTAMKSITAQFDASRSDRRTLARRIAKDLWRSGERLTQRQAKPQEEVNV